MARKRKSAKPGMKSVAKERNPVSLNPLMRKSHAHTKSKKAERAQGKKALRQALRDE